MGGQPADVVVWETVPCPRCGLVVAFLPGQRRNRCGHCGKRVRR
jgi:ribosomal protein S27AE